MKACLRSSLFASQTNNQEYNYTITYGGTTLKVQYAESQTSTAKPGDLAGSNLHWHERYQNPNLTQMPQLGVAIRACEMDTEYPDNEGHPVIAHQLRAHQVAYALIDQTWMPRASEIPSGTRTEVSTHTNIALPVM